VGNSIEDAVNKGTGLVRPEPLAQLNCFVQYNLGGNIRAVEQLKNRQAQNVPVDNRYPLQPPVLGKTFIDGIDLFPCWQTPRTIFSENSFNAGEGAKLFQKRSNASPASHPLSST